MFVSDAEVLAAMRRLDAAVEQLAQPRRGTWASAYTPTTTANWTTTTTASPATPERSRHLPMTIARVTHVEDVAYASRVALGGLGDRFAEVTLRYTAGGDGEWPSRATSAWQFLRRNASGRYSNNALMRVLREAETADWGDRPPPCLLELEVPYEYDPDTEVKKGGTLGVLFQLNDSMNRALMAVPENLRRQGVGGALVKAHLNLLGEPTFWVHSTNADAQRFLLANEFTPRAMNQQNALHYARVYIDDEEV